jgi:hypothetical protein
MATVPDCVILPASTPAMYPPFWPFVSIACTSWGTLASSVPGSLAVTAIFSCCAICGPTVL